jgi:hypothetical protein
MGLITPFAFEDHLVRAVERRGEPWFVGKDVCDALDIRNHNDALKRLDDDERAEVGIADPSGTKYATIISEPGVYRLVFTSRKAEAERFKRWLAHEVLPALRRNGRFDMNDKPAEPPASAGEGSIALLNWRLACVSQARLIHGPARAALLWSQIGLPPVPSAPDAPCEARNADADAMNCLAHLLDWSLNDYDKAGKVTQTSMRGFIERAIDGDEEDRLHLMHFGVRIEENGEGETAFWVASYSRELSTIFAGTQWAGRWRHALKRLPGARGTGNYKVDRAASRGVRIPERWLDPRTD